MIQTRYFRLTCEGSAQTVVRVVLLGRGAERAEQLRLPAVIAIVLVDVM